MAPQPEAPARGKTTQRDAAGKQIAKRHDRLNQFNPPMGELLLKFQPVPGKDDPWQRVICAGKWTAGWKVPTTEFRAGKVRDVTGCRQTVTRG